MKCDKCGSEFKELCYELKKITPVSFCEHNFCSRRCLIEHIAPELKQAVVIEQWVPTTQEEVDRMTQ
jgi:hypothetical protein